MRYILFPLLKNDKFDSATDFFILGNIYAEFRDVPCCNDTGNVPVFSPCLQQYVGHVTQ
jgi:hypothetical protein